MQSKPYPWFLLGMAAALLGLLPWIVHGGGLPLQNLGAEDQPRTRPFVLLPFSQYEVSTVATLLVTGGAIAGLGARLLPGGITRRRRTVLVGMLLIQTVAIVQTAAVVGAQLQTSQIAVIYLALLVAGSIASVLLSVGVLLLTSSTREAPVVVGIALAAVLASSWVGTIIVSPTDPYSGPLWLLSALRWLAPIIVGVAVAWSGVATVGRALAALFAAITLWIGPALLTAIVNSIGTRVYAKYPAQMLRAGVDVFRMALGSVDVVVPPLIVAAVIAVAGIVIRNRLDRRRESAERSGV